MYKRNEMKNIKFQIEKILYSLNRININKSVHKRFHSHTAENQIHGQSEKRPEIKYTFIQRDKNTADFSKEVMKTRT